MKKIEFPISMQYKKYECFFRIYQPDFKGDIFITLQMNTINDEETHCWVYGNTKDFDEVGSTRFFQPLIEFYDELHHLTFAWEGQDHRYSNGKYFKGSMLYSIPIYDGNHNIKQIVEDFPFPAMHYIKSLV